MKVLHQITLNRADLDQLGKYLRMNNVEELVIKRNDRIQTLKWKKRRLCVDVKKSDMS
jgi:hypothetical protein